MRDSFVKQSFAGALADPTSQGMPVSLDGILAEGSKSFYAASKLLPKKIRKPVTVLYAFCRIADDTVDDAAAGRTALDALRRRLDDIYRGRPAAHPLDRAFFETVSHYRIPQAIVSALLQGFEWDRAGRRYETIEDTTAYCARVASTVGVMMTLIMGERRAGVLARACDLGIAMQLVNICRDVGEDADMGRVYLPNEWLRQAGIDREAFLAHPVYTPVLGEVVKKTLDTAARHFELADIGIGYLHQEMRRSICAARLIYADIGRVIRKNRYDSVSSRAYTGTLRKLWLCLHAGRSKSSDPLMNAAPPHPSAQFLIDAIAAHDAVATHDVARTPGRGAR